MGIPRSNTDNQQDVVQCPQRSSGQESTVLSRAERISAQQSKPGIERAGGGGLTGYAPCESRVWVQGVEVSALQKWVWQALGQPPLSAHEQDLPNVV